MARVNAKFMTGLSPVMPVEEAARVVAGTRLKAVAKLLPLAIKAKPGSEDGERAIHALRVSTRRASAALAVFRPLIGKKEFRKARRCLRAIRKAAGLARDCDVQIGILKRAGPTARQAHQKAALKYLTAQTRSMRRAAQEPLERVLAEQPGPRLRRAFDRVVESIESGRAGGAAFRAEARMVDAARVVLESEIERVLKVAGSGDDLRNLDRVHELRIELKRLRYGMEVFGSCFGREFRDRLYPELIALQECLGTVNDAYVLIGRVERELAAKPAPNADIRRGLRVLLAEQREMLASAHAAFMETWKRFASGTFFDALRRELHAGIGGRDALHEVVAPFIRPAVPVANAQIEAKPALNGLAHHGKEHARPPARFPGGKRRIAAIDVGTNSIRLIVAEASPDGSYRILDDEKEITRLGRGLHKSGRMDPAAMEHTAVTVARMKSIALGYGAEEVRVVGTAAAREAKNAADLRRLLRERAGMDMEVISGEDEAMLAYRSAARAFDLSGQSGLVVDIGGGSTELVLSAASGGVAGNAGGLTRGAGAGSGGEGGGVIEGVFSIPIGAVRLTEMFGGAEKCSGTRFDEMRAYVKGLLKEQVGRPPILPQLIIGTGGTLTTLAAMALHREMGGNADGLFGKVQGTEVTRAEIKHLLEYLRKLEVKERTRVPGLSADRADIIIAGLVIVDAVLKRFGANRLRVHEGGIRDGLLLDMVRRMRLESPTVRSNAPHGGPEARPDGMKSVRRFAKDCGYEAAHAKQVTRLALRIFDQMAQQRARVRLETAVSGRGEGGEGMKFDGEARMLLEASSLLHDIGYLINYAQHHKHSYHLIVHADLAGLTTRQVHVIANVARYHRSAEPKPKHRNFAMLTPEDRALVRGLAGILRIADGLDRTHMQNVREVGVKLEKGAAHFDVRAAEEPAVDIWGAVRKSGLYRACFGVLPHFEWRRPGEDGQARPGGAVPVETAAAS